MQTITIEAISRKMIQTSKGMAEKIAVKGSDNIWYTCFYSPIVDSWKKGDDIEVEVEVNDTYHNIVNLPYGDGGDSQRLKTIEFQLNNILNILDPDGRFQANYGKAKPKSNKIETTEKPIF